MSDGQRIIKYVAYAWAWVLVVMIVSGIVSAIMGLGYIFDNSKDNGEIGELRDIAVSSNISDIKIDARGSNLIIRSGDSFRVQTNNKYVKAEVKGDTLYVTQSGNWSVKKNYGQVLIDVPNGVIVNNLDVEAGAGEVRIDGIQAKVMNLDLGAGRVDINNVIVLNKTDIDGGAGKTDIKNSSLSNLDLDMGVGSFDFEGEILGSSDISQGVGETNIALVGGRDTYTIKVDKGLGNVSVDGSSISSGTVIGNGLNRIEIDGGVGSIKVSFLSANG